MVEPTPNADQQAKPKPEPKPEPKPRQPMSPWTRRLIVAGVVLFALGMSYLTGRMQTATRIDQAEQRSADLEQEATQTEGDLSAERALVQRLEARRQLHLLLLALDERNFGIAEKHLAAAVRHLERSKPEPSSDLGKLTASMRQYDLIATEDLGKQRRQIIGWVERFDTAVPTVKPAP